MGFRGIFLDSIHPKIAARLDADTRAFAKFSPEAGAVHTDYLVEGLEVYKYLQERTPWMRSVPFAVPQSAWSVQNETSIRDWQTRGSVPNWREWVIWGTSANPPSATVTHDEDSGLDVTTYKYERWAHQTEGRKGRHALYRGERKSWDGSLQAGTKNTPLPGIVSLQVSNKGDMGTIRRCSFDIKCYSLTDLEAIEMMYMVPGINVLVEFGWYHPLFSVEPIDLNKSLPTAKNINEEIIRKTLGVDDLMADNDTYMMDAGLGPKSGIYDGLLGTITKFNWTTAADGTYDARVDLIAPGSLASGVTVESYALGSTQVIEGRDIPVSDLRSIAAVVRATTGNLETARVEKENKDKFDARKKSFKFVDVSGDECTYSFKKNDTNYKYKAKWKIDVDAGVKITPDGEGGVKYEVTEVKTNEDEYFLGEYQNDEAYEMFAIKGDCRWFANAMYDVTTSGYSKSKLWGNGAGHQLSSKEAFSNIGSWFDLGDEYYEGNDAKGFHNHVTGPMARGDYYVTDTACSPNYRGWRLYVRKQGEWITGCQLDEYFKWNVSSAGSRLFYRKWSSPYMYSVSKANSKQGVDFTKSGKYKQKKNWMGSFTNKMNGDQAVDELGWGFKDGTLIDAAGNKQGEGVTTSKKWGALDDDMFVLEKVEGVTVYKRDSEGTVTKVQDIKAGPGESADDLKAELGSGINNQVTTVNDATLAEYEADKKERLSKINDIKASIQNDTALSWGGKVAFGKTYLDGSMIYAHGISKFAPQDEVNYKFFPSSDGKVVMYPIGCVAYSETYVSWRFIEDYVINELYMPRTNIPSTDPTGSVNYNPILTELETSFQTVTQLTLTEQNKMIHQGQKTEWTEEERQKPIHSPDMIINHKHLRSFNPYVCILPGQESVPDIKVASDLKNKVKGVDSKFRKRMLEHSDTVEPLLKKSGKCNLFLGWDENGQPDYSRGVLRNILVNIDIIEEAADKSNNVRKFCNTLLAQINKACGNPWDFKIGNLSQTNQLKIIDQAYVPDVNKGRIPDSHMREDGVYMFDGIGAQNICKDVKIQSKIPQELQTMAYYASMNGPKDKGSGIQMFNMYRAGIQDRLKAASGLSVTGTDDNSDAGKDLRAETEATLLASYMQLCAQSRWAATYDKTDDPSVKEGQEIAKDFVKKYIHGDTTQESGTKTYRPPIPLDVNLTLNGVSGIYMGNAIMLKTIAEGGMLPSRYQGNVALQATAVDHSITPEGWTTDIQTLMRPLPDSKNEAFIKVNVPQSNPSTALAAGTFSDPSDLPLANPFGSAPARVTSYFGGSRKHKGTDLGGVPQGTPLFNCLKEATMTCHLQTVADSKYPVYSSAPWVVDGVPAPLAYEDGRTGYGWWIILVGTGYQGKKWSIHYGHLAGFANPDDPERLLTWQDLQAGVSDFHIESSSTKFKCSRKVKGGEVVGFMGGEAATPGAGSSTGPHLHLTVSPEKDWSNRTNCINPHLVTDGFYDPTLRWWDGHPAEDSPAMAYKEANYAMTPYPGDDGGGSTWKGTGS